ncbi:MAG: methyltransferase domain-containing protein [Planctomycetota bacterium]
MSAPLRSLRRLVTRLRTGRVGNAAASEWPRLAARAAALAARTPDVLVRRECAVCGGTSLRVAAAGWRPPGAQLYPGGRRIPRRARRVPLIYEQCAACGAARINPTFRDDWIDGVEAAAAPPATHWMEDPAYVADKQASVLAHCERMQVQRFRSERNAALDVSCGAGVGLAALRDRLDWRDCRGTECDPAAVRIAREVRGLDVQQGLVHRVALPAGAFDLAVLDNALEHHADPLAALRAVRAALRPGGAALVIVPNFDGHTVAHLGVDYWNLNWGHWHYFTLPSLARLLTTAGLCPERAYCEGVEAPTAIALGAAPAGTFVELDGAAIAAVPPLERRLRGDYLTVLAVAV